MQWQLKHASLGKVLSVHVAGSVEEQGADLKAACEHGQTETPLRCGESEVAEKGRTGGERTTSLYDELNEGVTAQLMARFEMMVNDASLLERESARRMDAVLLRSFSCPWRLLFC